MNKTSGIVSLVCGILSCVFGWIGDGTYIYTYGILGVIGLALGIVALVMSSKSKKENGPSGLATAGLITGIIGIVFAAIGVICAIACAGALACASAA